jgi:hypothetical protein
MKAYLCEHSAQAIEPGLSAELDGLEGILDLMVARVIERDEPPRIFGIAIKPTLYQVDRAGLTAYNVLQVS